MPHSIFFMKDGHAIHGSFEVKNLGQPVSHGCVRISPKNAAILFALVKENGLGNTQVVVSGDTPGGESISSRMRQVHAASIRSIGVSQVHAGSDAHPAFPITLDPRITMDLRGHGPIHLGEGQAVALIGDDL